jgi:hypothetical protein
MELQAINQTISPSILGKTKVFYCPRWLSPWLIDLAKDIYVPWERNLRLNMLRKYVIIKLHNLKLDTGNAHIEPLQN